MARGAARRARLLPGPRPRRRRLVPGRTRQPRRLRAPAREGGAPARAVRARAPRRRRGERCSRSVAAAAAVVEIGLARAAARRPTSDAERTEEPVQVDAEPPEAVEEEQRAEGDEHRAADELDHHVVVADPAEEPIAGRTATPRAETGRRARASRRRAGTRPRAPCRSRRRAPGSRRARRRCTARRRPRTRRRAGRPSRCGARPGRARRDQPLRQGSRPMKTSPKTISRKPAICSSRTGSRRSRGRSPPRRRRARRRPREPATNGQARDDDPPRRPRLAQPVGLDRRDRREVAGHERQHARARGTRRSPRGTRRDAGRAHGLGLEAGELLVEPPFDAPGSSGRLVGGARRSAGRAIGSSATRAPTATAATADPGERQQPREQVEALRAAARRAPARRTARRASP